MIKYLLLYILLISGIAANAQAIGPASLKAIDSIMRSYYPAADPGASVVVAKNGQIIMSKGYGMANLEHQVSNSSQSVFRIGSMTKQFTAIAILQLIQKGQLNLTDRLSKFYPELYANDRGNTISHLLSHTSGIKDYITIPEVRALATQKNKPQTIIGLIAKAPLDFEPGTNYTYSNSGYYILGDIIEQVTKVTYKDYLAQNIFKPLQMTHSVYEDPADVIPNRASGYYRRPAGFINAPFVDISVIYAAGALLTTAEDMVKWDESLYQHTLIEEKYLKMAFAPQRLSNGNYTDYGYGFRFAKVNGVNSIEHGGGVFGFQCYGIRIESAHVYVLVLSNFEGSNKYDQASAQIAAVAIGRPYSQNKVLPISAKVLKEYPGVFFGSDNTERTVILKNDSLFYVSDKIATHLIPIAKDIFKLSGTLDDQLSFVRINNKITAIYIKPRRAVGVTAAKVKPL